MLSALTSFREYSKVVSRLLFQRGNPELYFRTCGYQKAVGMSVGSTSRNRDAPVDPEDKIREQCLFCRIIDEKGQDLTNLTYKDDEVVVFSDIRPAAKYHYLVCPREHIKDCKSLTPAQINLVDRLVEIGHKVVNEKIEADSGAEGKSVNANDVPKLLGFHWPPFHSIAHLHLHVIAPADSMGFISRTIFRPNSWWFVTPEYVKERLSKDVILPVDNQNKSPGGSPTC